MWAAVGVLDSELKWRLSIIQDTMSLSYKIQIKKIELNLISTFYLKLKLMVVVGVVVIEMGSERVRGVREDSHGFSNNFIAYNS